jgi:hypothetical protein
MWHSALGFLMDSLRFVKAPTLADQHKFVQALDSFYLHSVGTLR